MKLKQKIFGFFAKLTLFFLIFGIFIFSFLYYYYRYTLPSIDEIVEQNTSQSLNIFYSNGIDLIKSKNNSGLNKITFNELPKNLVNALLATEDRKFFEHRGIDFLGIIRAFFVNIFSGRIKQGGSTITQQLSKIIIGDSSKTFRRKFKELVLTRKLEKYLTKEDIMTLYLSKSYFGAGQYGISEATRFYFDKSFKDLQLEECAMLVGLLKAPTKYNPTNNKELTKERTTQVIINMQKAGFIDENDIYSYIIPELQINSDYSRKKQLQNYFFTDWIENQINDYGIDKNANEVNIITTLDKFIQKKTIEVVNFFVSEKNYILKNAEIAVVVMNKNGEILSMVGGKNYSKSQFNRTVYANRQTGSLFKLFVYLAGFENGMKINDIFIDEPIKIGNWYPENYGRKYTGNISVKDAFAFSSNSVAVQIADYFGIENVIKIAKKLGINGNFKKDMTIALGSQESNLLDMTTAYANIVNNGVPVIPHGLKKIETSEKVLYSRNISAKHSLFSKKSVENMQYLLFSTITEGTGKRASIDRFINETNIYNMLYRDNKFFIGGKTGSTQNNRDAWFIGFVKDLIIGIWIGNDNNEPMNGIMGGNLPAELWKTIAKEII